MINISTVDTVEAIHAAKRRVVYLAPGIHDTIGDALAGAWSRLGGEAVTVIVDSDPEVFRLGYGTIEALDRVQAAAASVGALVCCQPGIRIGIAIIDDHISFFAPKPLLIASDNEAEMAGFRLALGETSEQIAADLGAGPEGESAQTIGLDGLSSARMQEIKSDLKSNPPQRFEVAQTVRVFNTSFQFCELEVKGCRVSEKSVTLPADLIAVPSEDVRKRLRASYRLLEANEKISGAQREVEQLRKEIERRFLHVIPSFGRAILRKDRELFDIALTDLKQAVACFQEIVRAEVERAIESSKDEIARALSPAIEDTPTTQYMQWARYQEKPTPMDYVRAELDRCFRVALGPTENMSVEAQFKDVAYECLKSEEFLAAARKAFPELKELFAEFEAARAAVQGRVNTEPGERPA
jgi:hypothetical protein